MRLEEVGSILDSATWVRLDGIYRFIVIGGYVPVEPSFSGSVFSIHILRTSGEDAIFLTLSRKITCAQLLEVLQGRSKNRAVLDTKILDVWPRVAPRQSDIAPNTTNRR
jgi:hypothetical protein